MKSVMKKMGAMLVASLLLVSVVLVSVHKSDAKGETGKYSARMADDSTFVNPNNGMQLDQAGTPWNLPDDVYSRQMRRAEKVDYNNLVTVSSAGAGTASFESLYITWASSQTYYRDKYGNLYGWTIAVPTNTVNTLRTKVRIFNLPTNTQTMYVNIATGAISSLLTYPATAQYYQDLLVGESLELEISTFCHPVISSTGTISTEKAQVTQFE
jgi:hypothetical protein